MYVTTPRVHISVGKETKSKLTTSGARNSGVPNETLSFSRGLYLQEKRADGYRDQRSVISRLCYYVDLLLVDFVSACNHGNQSIAKNRLLFILYM